MSTSEVAPLSYFSDVQLLESELVRFRMTPSRSQLDIVVIYAAETLDSYFLFVEKGGDPTKFNSDKLDFRLLRFVGVRNIETRLGPNVPIDRLPKGNLDNDWAAHEATLLAMRRLITYVDCERSGSNFICRMNFDSFGEHEWTFEWLLGDRIVATFSQRNHAFEYKNASTGEFIDASNPFVSIGNMENLN